MKLKETLIGAGEIVIILLALFVGLLVLTIGVAIVWADNIILPKLIEWTGLVFAALLLSLGVKPRGGDDSK